MEMLEGTIVSGTTPIDLVVRVDAIHGDGLGYRVGDRFRGDATFSGKLGARVLAPVAAGDGGRTIATDGGLAAVAGIVLDDNDTFVCSSGSPRLTKDQLIAAVRAPSCAMTLATFDGEWQRSTCGGCALGGVGADSALPTTVGILLALVSGLVRRRVVRALNAFPRMVTPQGPHAR